MLTSGEQMRVRTRIFEKLRKLKKRGVHGISRKNDYLCRHKELRNRVAGKSNHLIWYI